MRDTLEPASVSVVVPCYNLGRYLADAISSIKAQTYTDYEIIIVDDGSTDQATLDVLETFKGVEGIQVYHIKNRRLPGARNYGIGKARGEYVTCLDADDMFAPNYLEKTIAVLNADKDKEYGLCTTWLKEFGDREDVWQTGEYNIPKLLMNNLVHAASVFRRSVWQDVGGYSEKMKHGYEDWEFWLRFAEKGYKWKVIQEPLFLYRIRSNSMLASSKEIHTEIYRDMFFLHEDLFRKYLKDFAIEATVESRNLHQIISSKNESIRQFEQELQALQTVVVALRNDIFQLKAELLSLKESRFIGRIIILRERLGHIVVKSKRFPKKARSLLYVLGKRLLPFIIKKRLIAVRHRAILARQAMRSRPKIKDVVTLQNISWDNGTPLLSVIIPFYNRADTIDETIDSLKKQTYREFETIIVDDGSTDQDSVMKLKKLEKDKQVSLVVYQENQGVAVARNTGIAHARGKYVTCLDSDDVLDPTYLEKSLLTLEANPDVSLVTTHQQMFGVIQDLYLKSEYDPNELINDNMVISAATFKREAWKSTGGYKSGIGYEDWEFWLNQAEHGYWGKLIPEPLFLYRTSVQSRYVEDKDMHWKNVRTIRQLHPFYSKSIRRLLKERTLLRHEISTKTALLNLSAKSAYLQSKNNKPNVLLALPWMTFGGAETLIINFCNEVKDDVNIFFVTGLASEHEWEHKFREISSNIYHLANLFDSDELYLEFISNFITTRSIDVIHIVHTSFMFALLPEIKRRHPDLKIVVTVFNDRAEHFEQSVRMNEHIDVFTSDNGSVINHYTDLGVPKAKTRIIPNGINAYDTFNPSLYDREMMRKELSLRDQDTSVFFIGRLSEEKNPDVFIDSAEKTCAKYADTKFFVIGDGAMRSQIEEQISKLKNDNVVYLGYQSEIAKYLSAADIFVLPSSVEGFPLSILEAMAMNVAVIASDVGAVSEVIEEGEGYVITPGSATEIATRVELLRSDRGLLQQIKTRARKKVEFKYSNIQLGANYKKLYRDVTE